MPMLLLTDNITNFHQSTHKIPIRLPHFVHGNYTSQNGRYIIFRHTAFEFPFKFLSDGMKVQ